jgi:hypothetical protein
VTIGILYQDRIRDWFRQPAVRADSEAGVAGIPAWRFRARQRRPDDPNP